MSHRISTRHCTGPLLAWAVAQCEGLKTFPYVLQYGWKPYRPDIDPQQAQPILLRTGIRVEIDDQAPPDTRYVAMHRTESGVATITLGPSELLAGMRCHVASRIGHFFDVPPFQLQRLMA